MSSPVVKIYKKRIRNREPFLSAFTLARRFPDCCSRSLSCGLSDNVAQIRFGVLAS